MENTKCSEDYLTFFKLAHCMVRTFVSKMLLAEMQAAGYPNTDFSSMKFRC